LSLLLFLHLLQIEVYEVAHILLRIRRLMLRHCFLKQVPYSPQEEGSFCSVTVGKRNVCIECIGSMGVCSFSALGKVSAMSVCWEECLQCRHVGRRGGYNVCSLGGGVSTCSEKCLQCPDVGNSVCSVYLLEEVSAMLVQVSQNDVPDLNDLLCEM
jgi:hypothetical protein